MKRFFIGVLMVSIFVGMYSYAHAETATDSVDLPALILSKQLTFGQNDPEVKKLQQYLIDNGFLDAKTVLSNRYGEKTRLAVKLLQAKLGITSNGASLGPKTKNALALLRGKGKKLGLLDQKGNPSDVNNQSGTGTNNQGGNTKEEGGGRCVEGSTTTPITLSSALTGTLSPTYVVTSTGGVGAGNWMDVMLTNPGTCPVTVSKMEFALGTNELSSWAPVQNVKLMHAGTQLGNMLHRYDGAGPAGTAMFAGPGTLSFLFTGTSAVTILPGASKVFKLISDSRNVPSEGSLVTSSTGSTSIVGTPYYFTFQLTEFLGTSSLGVINDQTVTAGSIPSTIITPHINIYQ